MKHLGDSIVVRQSSDQGATAFTISCCKYQKKKKMPGALFNQEPGTSNGNKSGLFCQNSA